MNKVVVDQARAAIEQGRTVYVDSCGRLNLADHIEAIESVGWALSHIAAYYSFSTRGGTQFRDVETDGSATIVAVYRLAPA